MNDDRFWAWDLSEEITDEKAQEVECPECKEWSIAADWSETSVGCELCGEHAAIRCPKCYESFDHVHGPVFIVRPIKPNTNN